MSARLRLTLRRSVVGTNPSARGTVRALGLRRIGQTVELADDVTTRGQVRAVRYLLDVEEVGAREEAPARATAASGRRAASAKRSSTTSGPAAAPARRAASTASRKEAQS
jgi:large subunit ribosomal protein L30